MLIRGSNLYFIKEYCRILIITIAYSTSLILILDFAEIMRITAQDHGVTMAMVGFMTLAKCLSNVINLMPIMILIATFFTFSILTKRNEMVILSMLGMSHHTYIKSIICVLVTLYLCMIFVLLPIQRFVSTHSIHGCKEINQMFFRNSLNTFIKADRQNDVDFKNITLWLFDENFKLKKTILSNNGVIRNNQLILNHAKAAYSSMLAMANTFTIPMHGIDLTNTIIPPEQMNFFFLPKSIEKLQLNGFSTIKHERYFIDHITSIITFLTMGLLGFSGSFRITNRLFDFKRMFIAGGIGLSIFFTMNLIVSLFLSQSLNIMMSTILARLCALSIVIAYLNKSIEYEGFRNRN